MRQVITFDAYGTLIDFRLSDVTREVLPVRDIAPSQVTHVAQGWEYDLIPTRDLGVRRRVWINRYGRPGSSRYRPYDELPDLSGVPALLGPGHAP